MYVKTCERGRVKDFEQRSRVFIAVCYNTGFPPYSGVAVYIPCTLHLHSRYQLHIIVILL